MLAWIPRVFPSFRKDSEWHMNLPETNLAPLQRASTNMSPRGSLLLSPHLRDATDICNSLVPH